MKYRREGRVSGPLFAIVALLTIVAAPMRSSALENGLTYPCSIERLQVLEMNENMVEHGMRSITRAYDNETPIVRSAISLFVDINAHTSRFEEIRDESEAFSVGHVHCRSDGAFFCDDKDGFSAVSGPLTVHFCEPYWNPRSLTHQAAVMFHEHTHTEYGTRDWYYDSCSTQLKDWDVLAGTENYRNVRLDHFSRSSGQCASNGVSYSVKLGKRGGVVPIGAPSGCTTYWSEHAWFCDPDTESINADTWEAVWYTAFVTELQTLFGGHGWLNRQMNEYQYVWEEWRIAGGRDVYDEITCSWSNMSASEQSLADTDQSFFDSEFEGLRYYEFLYGPSHSACDGIGLLHASIENAAFDYPITTVAQTQLPPGSPALQTWLAEHDAALMMTMF